jgi:hypothetical protein
MVDEIIELKIDPMNFKPTPARSSDGWIYFTNGLRMLHHL